MNRYGFCDDELAAAAEAMVANQELAGHGLGPVILLP